MSFLLRICGIESSIRKELQALVERGKEATEGEREGRRRGEREARKELLSLFSRIYFEK